MYPLYRFEVHLTCATSCSNTLHHPIVYWQVGLGVQQSRIKRPAVYLYNSCFFLRFLSSTDQPSIYTPQLKKLKTAEPQGTNEADVGKKEDT